VTAEDAKLAAANRKQFFASTADKLDDWLNANGIVEVECMVPDMNGIVRGKILPATKMVRSVRDGALKIASSIIVVTLTGDYPEDPNIAPYQDPDMTLIPDPASLRVAPYFKVPTAVVIADPYDRYHRPIEIYPRFLLKRVIALYAERGWKALVAPEVEFFLTSINTDPDVPLQPPIGRNGRAETASEPYGLDAINEFEEIIDKIYEHSEKAGLDLDTMIHEAGAAQLEINFNHGDPLELADQVILFKRIVRQVALDNGMYATFMAKPMDDQPGSAMHLHQSVVDIETGHNLFANADGSDSTLFRSHVAGLQQHLPQITLMFAPNVNSFRRMRPAHDAPINVQWGLDNRSCGLRVPISDPENRRIENRLPGADANPYLSMAASLVAGYLGMIEASEPRPQVEGSAYRLARTLPRTLNEALDKFSHARAVRNLLGEPFFDAFAAIKMAELEAYQDVVSAWEREHLLLKV
jgi:glutamine synthetase